jgi:hypothetical protein
MTEQQEPTAGAIIAKPARDYRWKRYALVLVLLGYGLWSIHDGFFKYPQDNAENERLYPGSKPPHGQFDIPLNQALGIALPPLSLLFLAWVFYNSRGTYRLEGDTLNVPGHPPIPLNAMRKINRAKWDRKGIAYVEYQIPGMTKGGRFKLDDFIYEREPTDQIFAAVELAVSGGPPIGETIEVLGTADAPPASEPAKKTGPVRIPPAAIPAPPPVRPKPRQ